jgi:hypothetical protein
MKKIYEFLKVLAIAIGVTFVVFPLHSLYTISGLIKKLREKKAE